MAKTADDLLEQLDRHLASPSQAWILGAGISFNAGIPLMYALTDRVTKKAIGTETETILNLLKNELPDNFHIEHVLSQLGDYAALSARSKTKQSTIFDKKIDLEQLNSCHRDIVTWIAETIRWGYIPERGGVPEQIGAYDKPLVKVDDHRSFVRALFHTNQAGLQDRRGAVKLFSTNYDTLLEDALALEAIPYWDGFSGGAVAFRNFHFGETPPTDKYRAHVIKLHGSIDWHLSTDGRVWRVREGDTYPTKAGRVLIHPQATKYTATQLDPFAVQFDILRRTLATSADNVLGICGYSFGDEHINQEIELALSAPNSRTTLLIFLYEPDEWPECLTKWRESDWGKRIYIATQKGLYNGADGPFSAPPNGESKNWWTFAGLTKLINDGSGVSEQ